MASAPVPAELVRLADDRRRRVEEMKARVPGYELRTRIRRQEPAGRLERALRRGGAQAALRLLCEVKRSRPGPGPSRADLDPVALARLFAQGGAAGVSLVAEPEHLQGDLAWLDAVRPAVQLPILLTDLVVDSYQLIDAAVRGADGVLLVAGLLSGVQLQRLIGEARLLGLDGLVAVRGADELAAAVRAGATLVGLDHRGLPGLESDLETSLAVLAHVPPLVTAVIASDPPEPDVLRRIRETRCDAVLVGEAVTTSPDPAGTLARFVAAARG